MMSDRRLPTAEDLEKDGAVDYSHLSSEARLQAHASGLEGGVGAMIEDRGTILMVELDDVRQGKGELTIKEIGNDWPLVVRLSSRGISDLGEALTVLGVAMRAEEEDNG